MDEAVLLDAAPQQDPVVQEAPPQPPPSEMVVTTKSKKKFTLYPGSWEVNQIGVHGAKVDPSNGFTTFITVPWASVDYMEATPVTFEEESTDQAEDDASPSS